MYGFQLGAGYPWRFVGIAAELRTSAYRYEQLDVGQDDSKIRTTTAIDYGT